MLQGKQDSTSYICRSCLCIVSIVFSYCGIKCTSYFSGFFLKNLQGQIELSETKKTVCVEKYKKYYNLIKIIINVSYQDYVVYVLQIVSCETK